MLDVSRDETDRVVELVRHARHQLAEATHLLGLNEMRFGLFETLVCSRQLLMRGPQRGEGILQVPILLFEVALTRSQALAQIPTKKDQQCKTIEQKRRPCS